MLMYNRTDVKYPRKPEPPVFEIPFKFIIKWSIVTAAILFVF